MATTLGPLRPGLPAGFVTLSSHSALEPLWILANARTAGALLLAVMGLGLRYRRGGEDQRRQLLWFLLAAIVAVVFFCAVLVASAPKTLLFAVPLIPATVTIAILRHQLLDIRLVVSRFLAWLLLSVAAVAAYVVLLAVLALFVSANLGRSAVATVVVAVVVAPLLPRLQRLVDRAMYGDRRDPARMAAKVGRLLQGPGGGLAGVVSAVRHALRVPYVAVTAFGSVLASDGTRPTAPVHSIPLAFGVETVGELVVGLRPGERAMAEVDRDALALVAVPLAVAIHATGLSAELSESRERLVAAREEERQRLRRDLHDGLGPALTGVAMAADAAANLVGRDATRGAELIASVRRDTRLAIGDVRRLIDNLRPLALEELGLLGALRRRAQEISSVPGGVTVQVLVDRPDATPAIPSGVEVAAFRIVTEALTNVVRHSEAQRAVVRLRYCDVLEVEIVDNGPANNGPWQAGVGLQAMRERAGELGGLCEVGPSPEGGRVYVSLPLGPQ
jgi:signal transduction histidine kinase